MVSGSHPSNSPEQGLAYAGASFFAKDIDQLVSAVVIQVEMAVQPIFCYTKGTP